MKVNEKRIDQQEGTTKQLEIYLFVDPLCPDCWALEPVLKKLWMEYGQYFTLRHVLTGQLDRLNGVAYKRIDRHATRIGIACEDEVLLETPLPIPYVASLSVKAAELQGRQASIRFLRQLQEIVFIQGKTMTDTSTLIQCAIDAGLDVQEFINDLSSPTAVKAFQCDLKISAEMDVREVPTLVFFNENIEDEGIKISGCYPYDVYVDLIHEMLGFHPQPSPLPPIEQFLHHAQFVTIDDIAMVYNIPRCKAECELKKLRLKQKVEQIGSFWRWIDKEKRLG
ncbi:DsbA family protein [Anoxybacillus ayderensis]|uniref:ClpXP adapter SpxH family protein n=1 Tax=Anoxybacillus TaxID=150247 RepID=UPI000373DA48|nr:MULTISPECIES: ClpXP adapter SpxH family protein [Anoxybacillus]AXM88255.1 DsbA family protein [Anoxybacillus ayderensis G10]MBW9217412.1 DsbA family protein [Anoxybacillus sp. ST70]MCQ5364044.1 DsbA family protein [Anoxybacillus gonensis]THD16943.1 DsbA family protein [Anoxybacillus ayderensis]